MGPRPMKSEIMLELLESAADQLGVKVSYEPLQTSGIQTGLRGGLCKVKGEFRCIVDKRATPGEKATVLAQALARMDLDDIFITEEARRRIERFRETLTNEKLVDRVARIVRDAEAEAGRA